MQQKNQKINRKHIYWFLLFTQLINFTLLYCYGPKITFEKQLDRDPVPFNEPLANKLVNGRIVTLKMDSFYGFSSIGFNYATMWGLYHFAGYEPLLSTNQQKTTLMLNSEAQLYKKELPISYFRDWGVKWYIVGQTRKWLVEKTLKLIYSDNQRYVFYDPKAKPLFYWVNKQNEAGIISKINVNSIILNTKTLSKDTLVINFLYNPYFHAKIDGKIVTITSTPARKMSIIVPQGTHRLIILYENPYFKIGIQIAATFLAGLLAWYLFRIMGRYTKGIRSKI